MEDEGNYLTNALHCATQRALKWALVAGGIFIVSYPVYRAYFGPDEGPAAHPMNAVVEQKDVGALAGVSLEDIKKEARGDALEKIVSGDAVKDDVKTDKVQKILNSLPRKVSVLDKSNPPRRKKAGPKEYLFDMRGVGPLDIVDIMGDMIGSYKEKVAEKCKEKGIPTPFISDYNFAPFYDMIRDPTDEQLRFMYALSKMSPDHVLKDFRWKKVRDDFMAAKALLKKEEETGRMTPLYKGKWSKSGYVTGKKSYPANLANTGRLPNGELVIKTREDGEMVMGDPLVFGTGLEHRLSPLTKFLYRRGLQFTENAEKMIRVYGHAGNADDFVMLYNAVER
jgi:hypothetical protein